MAAIVCLTDRRGTHICSALSDAGHHVYTAYTADLVVCLCVQHYVDVAVLEQDLFIETNGWSIAQSIKAVRPSVRVILVTDAEMLTSTLPTGVDTVIHSDDLKGLVQAVEQAGRSNDGIDMTGSQSHTIQ